MWQCQLVPTWTQIEGLSRIILFSFTGPFLGLPHERKHTFPVVTFVYVYHVFDPDILAMLHRTTTSIYFRRQTTRHCSSLSKCCPFSRRFHTSIQVMFFRTTFSVLSMPEIHACQLDLSTPARCFGLLKLACLSKAKAFSPTDFHCYYSKLPQWVLHRFIHETIVQKTGTHTIPTISASQVPTYHFLPQKPHYSLTTLSAISFCIHLQNHSHHGNCNHHNHHALCTTPSSAFGTLLIR